MTAKALAPLAAIERAHRLVAAFVDAGNFHHAPREEIVRRVARELVAGRAFDIESIATAVALEFIGADATPAQETPRESA